MKLMLALSGGGFRATIFHLGVIRFLRDADLLKDVVAISSVSGGSITAAHLVLNWSDYLGPHDKFMKQQTKLQSFTQFGLRNVSSGVQVAHFRGQEWPGPLGVDDGLAIARAMSGP